MGSGSGSGGVSGSGSGGGLVGADVESGDSGPPSVVGIVGIPSPGLGVVIAGVGGSVEYSAGRVGKIGVWEGGCSVGGIVGTDFLRVACR